MLIRHVLVQLVRSTGAGVLLPLFRLLPSQLVPVLRLPPPLLLFVLLRLLLALLLDQMVERLSERVERIYREALVRPVCPKWATLTEQTLIVKKGLFNRIEKTIPLEKITDLALKQGPIMRLMGLNSLSVETAGASGSQSALVSLIGIVDTFEFRDTVLAQRDQQNSAKSQAGSASTQSLEGDVLNDIRDTLKRIEARLAKKGG